ncbi:hypothetical protein D3C80_178980 [compost metagenome]|uniref:hypothetical protein n=1 Tax=Aeromonas media TaxID=651 RepID=UPI000FB1D52B|nr:hypothetical protein [Aeromonas media]
MTDKVTKLAGDLNQNVFAPQSQQDIRDAEKAANWQREMAALEQRMRNELDAQAGK